MAAPLLRLLAPPPPRHCVWHQGSGTVRASLPTASTSLISSLCPPACSSPSRFTSETAKRDIFFFRMHHSLDGESARLDASTARHNVNYSRFFVCLFYLPIQTNKQKTVLENRRAHWRTRDVVCRFFCLFVSRRNKLHTETLPSLCDGRRFNHFSGRWWH